MMSAIHNPRDADTAPLTRATRVRTLGEEAKALAADLVGRDAEFDELRRLPDDVWRRLVDTGLVRALQPKRWGGSEAHPWEFYSAVMDVAAANASVAWVMGVIGVHPWQTATYSPETQDEIWGADPRTMNSSSYSPTGKAEKVEGGYRLSGRWQFSSGCDHCTWVNVGAIAGMTTVRDKTVPDFRSFLVPIGDYRIERTWNTAGLLGTGSHDIVMDGCFVPERRSISHWLYGTDAAVPGFAYNDGPLYRIPWALVFNFALAASVYGAAQGFFDVWLELSKTRIGSMNVPIVEDPVVQSLAARAQFTLEMARVMMEHNCNELYDAAVARRPLPLSRRALMRYETSSIAQTVGRLVDDLHQKSSGKIVFRDHPLQRRYQDIKAMIGHVFLDPDSTARLAGAGAFGRPILDASL